MTTFYTYPVTTRFPGNLSFIIEKIFNSSNIPTKELLICTDVLAYGYISNHAKFRQYERKLINILNNKEPSTKFEIVLYEENELKNTFTKQFKDKKDTIRDLLTNSTLCKWIEENDENRRSEISNISNYDDFIEFIYAVNLEMLQRINDFTRDKGVEVVRVKKDIPFFMWIADSDRAVISFPNYKDKIEHAFYTTDKELIKGFREIFFLIKADEYW